MVKPEQSNRLGPAAAYRYSAPVCFLASARIAAPLLDWVTLMTICLLLAALYLPYPLYSERSVRLLLGWIRKSAIPDEFVLALSYRCQAAFARYCSRTVWFLRPTPVRGSMTLACTRTSVPALALV